MGAALAELEPRCHVGKRCTQAGQVDVVGLIEIADDDHITGAAVVSHSSGRPVPSRLELRSKPIRADSRARRACVSLNMA
jgi:UDP-3-O-[3-hydroxymyristoyl] glucosamine N-acyltransferase